MTFEKTKGKFSWEHQVVWNAKTKRRSWKGPLNWNQRFRDKKTKFVIECTRRPHNGKTAHNASSKGRERLWNEQQVFVIVKYSNLWRRFCFLLQYDGPNYSSYISFIASCKTVPFKANRPVSQNVPKRFGPISGATIFRFIKLYSQPRGSKPSNFAILLVFLTWNIF